MNFDLEPTREIVRRAEKLYRRRALLAVHLGLYALWCSPVLFEFFTSYTLVTYGMKIAIFNVALILLPTVVIHMIWHLFFELQESAIRREIRAYRQGYSDALHVQDSYEYHDNPPTRFEDGQLIDLDSVWNAKPKRNG